MSFMLRESCPACDKKLPWTGPAISVDRSQGLFREQMKGSCPHCAQELRFVQSAREKFVQWVGSVFLLVFFVAGFFIGAESADNLRIGLRLIGLVGVTMLAIHLYLIGKTRHYRLATPDGNGSTDPGYKPH